MPYINRQTREYLKTHAPETVGELTFALSKICHDYIGGRVRFSCLAEVLAALEATKLEFYRCVLGPYEDLKRRENGSVSLLDRSSGSGSGES